MCGWSRRVFKGPLMSRRHDGANRHHETTGISDGSLGRQRHVLLTCTASPPGPESRGNRLASNCRRWTAGVHGGRTHR